MARCIELASKALGETYPNPMVGCVIVYQGKIIGEGYHKKAGLPHAEINAINSVTDQTLLPESTLYVSLEPCAHFGRTPPCAQEIINRGFKKVVIGTLDSHEKVNGKGMALLVSAGIQVVSGVLERECRELNKRFFTYQIKKRPYIVLKWAESADGFLDQEFKPYSISNVIAKQFVHRMRADENAILVGTGTALKDNPSLTVREISGTNPIRIVIDFDLRIPQEFNVYDKQAPTLIFNSFKSEISGNLEFIKCSRENFVPHLLSELHRRGIQSVIVEGGGTTLKHFINEDLWDEAIRISNPELELKNGTKASTIPGQPAERFSLKGNIVEIYRRASSI